MSKAVYVQKISVQFSWGSHSLKIQYFSFSLLKIIRQAILLPILCFGESEFDCHASFLMSHYHNFTSLVK